MLRKLALSGAAWTGAATLVTVVLQFAQIAVLARLLSPEDFGLMALVTLVIGFTQVYADAGLGSAVVQRQNATPEERSSLFWLNIVVGIAIFPILLAAAPLVAMAYGQPRLDALISIAAISFLIAPAGQQLHLQLQKALRFDLLAAIDVGGALCGVGCSIALALKGFGVYSMVLGQLAGTFVRSAILLGIGLRDWRPKLRLRRADLRGYVRFGTYQLLERTINYLGFNLDKLLIGSLVGVHGLGLYNIAYQLVMKPVQFVAPVVARVAFPLFAKVQEDDGRLRAGFLDCVRIVAFALFPVYAGIIVLAEPLTLLVLGEAWRETIPTIRILAILGFFYSIGNPVGALLLAKGRVEIGFYLNCWMIVLYAGAIAAGSLYGVNGVAAGLVIATALGLFPIGFWVRWLVVRMHPGEYVGAFSPMLASSLLMAAAVLGMVTGLLRSSDALVVLMTCIPFGAVVYLAIAVPWQRSFFLRVKGLLA